MDVITDLAAFPTSLPRPLMTIGNFDGVHLGHQAIFRTLSQRARDIGGSYPAVGLSGGVSTRRQGLTQCGCQLDRSSTV